MTDDRSTTEEKAAQRFAVLFSDCPVQGYHTWNLDTGKCQHCEAAFPYTPEEP